MSGSALVVGGSRRVIFMSTSSIRVAIRSLRASQAESLSRRLPGIRTTLIVTLVAGLDDQTQHRSKSGAERRERYRRASENSPGYHGWGFSWFTARDLMEKGSGCTNTTMSDIGEFRFRGATKRSPSERRRGEGPVPSHRRRA